MINFSKFFRLTPLIPVILIIIGGIAFADASTNTSTNSTSVSNTFCTLLSNVKSQHYVQLFEVVIVVVAAIVIVIQYFRLAAAKTSALKEGATTDLSALTSEVMMTFIGAAIVIAVVVGVAAIIPTLLACPPT